MPKPGMILMNSAALLPTETKFCSSLVVIRSDFSPESTGASASVAPGDFDGLGGGADGQLGVHIALVAAVQLDTSQPYTW